MALYPAALASSITLPMEILHAADNVSRAINRGPSRLQIQIAACDLNPVTTSGGVLLQPDRCLDELDDVDLLLLPAMWRNPMPTVRAHRSLLPQLVAMADRGAKICTVGSATWFLAEAGVLNGRAATTHWYFFDAFSRAYPGVDLKTRHTITQSDNLYCAGSVNSVADLMVHIVEQWLGNEVARAVEGHFSPEIRRPFEAHAYLSKGLGSNPDELIITAQEWLMDHASADITIGAMAAILGVSVRTLNRRFLTATGISPMTYLTQHRVNTAKEMLRTTDIGIGEVAFHVGYADASYFSSVFARLVGNTPGGYRRSIRGKLFSLQ
ncbi:MAG: transcriptional regulator GlxA family with amidase domain [Halieaceae bacterium]|jgi:transcriptional regulator GlxA family with amidase domain